MVVPVSLFMAMHEELINLRASRGAPVPIIDAPVADPPEPAIGPSPEVVITRSMGLPPGMKPMGLAAKRAAAMMQKRKDPPREDVRTEAAEGDGPSEGH